MSNGKEDGDLLMEGHVVLVCSGHVNATAREAQTAEVCLSHLAAGRPGRSGLGSRRGLSPRLVGSLLLTTFSRGLSSVPMQREGTLYRSSPAGSGPRVTSSDLNHHPRLSISKHGRVGGSGFNACTSEGYDFSP